MKCSKPRFAFRPLVENLESRLQPGSIITGQGYGWSLLADRLSILDQGSLDSQGLVAQSSSGNSRPTQSITPTAVHSDNLDIAVASVADVRSTSLPVNNLVDNSISAGFTDNNVSNSAGTGHSNALLLAAAAPSSQLPAPATPVGSVPQSPIGIATPVTPVQSANRNATSGNQVSVAPVAIAGPDMVQQASPIKTGLTLQPTPNLQVTTTHSVPAGINTHAFQPVWASYVGRQATQLSGAALDLSTTATQPVIAAGFTQDANDSTAIDGLLVRYSADGTSDMLTTLNSGAGTTTKFTSVDVDSAGNSYVVGQTNSSGTTTTLVASFDPTLKLNWEVTLGTPTTGAVGNGIRLDSTGTNLYLTGSFDGNLFVAELTNLNTTSPTQVYASVFNITGTGNAVAPDSLGNADVALTENAGADNLLDYGQVIPDGTMISFGHFLNTSGPKNAANGVFVDSSDNFYLTGTLFDGNASGFTVLLVAKFDASLHLQYGAGWQLVDPNNIMTRVADWIGQDIKVDGSGNAYMATTDNSGSGGNIALFGVDSTGGKKLDFNNVVFGVNDDQIRGLALDTTNNLTYMVGFTNSPDFGQQPNDTNYMATAAQPTYGGDPSDGVVIQDKLA